jgi:hypothetical protein
MLTQSEKVWVSEDCDILDEEDISKYMIDIDRYK